MSTFFSHFIVKDTIVDFCLFDGLIRYLVSQPFLRVFTKSPTAAIQSILHILFLPTPFKVLSESKSVSMSTTTSKSNSTPSASTFNVDGASKTASLLHIPKEEVLVPGALYADCAVVVNLTVKLDIQQMQVNDEVKAETSTSTNKEKRREEVIELPDDGEYGGELAGRLVWEAYEAGLKVWEKENPRPVEEEGGGGIIGDRKEESGGRKTGKRTQTNDEEHEDVYL
jgi:hypothetical protein